MLARCGLIVRAGVVIGFGALCVWSASGETRSAPAKPSASGLRYDSPAGDSFFSLSLKAGALKAAAEHDVVVLVDTSASQVGEHRRQALDVLDACLAALGENDRVQLFAVDVDAKPLMDGF